MRSLRYKRSGIALAVASVTALGGLCSPPVHAAGFIDDSTLTGGIYYWQRERDRTDIVEDKYKTNLSHSTWNANLDFQSGFAADMFGLDIAAFTAIEMAENGDSGHPNESRSPQATKPTTKTGPAIKAVSAFIKLPVNLNMARSGRGLAGCSLPVRRCWRRTGALCPARIRALKRARILTTARRAR